jgi:pimeloyl-ACP methyl ester carboxylesterase
MPKARLKSNITIHYQQIGEGPDLVMIHGLTGNLAIWQLKIIPMLWDHFRILTYDLRGHGYSEVTPTGYSADDMAGDLEDLLDALDIEKASLVGHSFGADVALYLALRRPQRVRQVVAIEAALPAMIYLRSREDWEGWDYWSDVLERSGRPVPPERRSDVLYLLRQSLEIPKKWGPLNGLPRKAAPYLRLIENTTIAPDSQRVGTLTLDKIPAISVPVYLIYSEGSAFVGTYHHLHSHLPNARGVLLPPTEWGHFGPLEQPELVAEEIRFALESELDGVKEKAEFEAMKEKVK